VFYNSISLKPVPVRMGTIGPAAQQTTEEGPSNPTIPITASRFEIKDQNGNFISGAAVTITTDNGVFLMTKLSDNGGNVSIGTDELDQALTNAGMSRGTWSQLLYSVSFPGKSTVSGVLFDVSQPIIPQVALKEITLTDASTMNWLVIPVLVVALGGVVYFATKKP